MNTQETNVYMFVVSWVLMIGLLTLFNRTRFGHVLIYYSLLLMILLILVSEYAQLTPLLSGIETPAALNAQLYTNMPK